MSAPDEALCPHRIPAGDWCSACDMYDEPAMPTSAPDEATGSRGEVEALAEERFWAKVDKSGDCWLWTGGTYRDGYGQFWVDGKKARAHRWAFEQVDGPIPEGLIPDHRCHTEAIQRGECAGGAECAHRRCVKPAHMELVTNAENVLRGLSPAALAARATHCINGHEFTEANTYVTRKGFRDCRACHNERSTERNRATFECPHCGETRNKSQWRRHLRAMHPEVAA